MSLGTEIVGHAIKDDLFFAASHGDERITVRAYTYLDARLAPRGSLLRTNAAYS